MSRTASTRLETDYADPRADDSGVCAFPAPEELELVADETRRAIVTTLWTAEDAPLQFSTLRRRSGIDESARFNYHLQRLLGQCVQDTDSGYVLTGAGEQFVEALSAVPTLKQSADGCYPADD